MRKYKTPVLRFVPLNSADIIATSLYNAPRMSTEDAKETDETGNFML